jgi:hypothetical protein
VKIILSLYAITKALPFVLTTKCYSNIGVCNKTSVCFNNPSRALRTNQVLTLIKLFFTLFLSWHKLKIQLQERNQNHTKIQPTRVSQRKPSGNQEIMPICGLTFQVTIRLLRVTLRPLTLQVESNLLRTSW